MKTYKISSIGRKRYKRFVSKEEYLMINNTDSGDDKILTLIKDARVEFNDKGIFEVVAYESDREVDIFWIEFESKETKKELESIDPGVYDLTINSNGEGILSSSNIESSSKILPIHTELKDLVAKADFASKNNILIYGQPGNGKTQSVIDLVNTMSDLVIINVLRVEPLRYLKNLPKSMKKILIFEEFTETMKLSDKRVVLNFLDGLDSVPNTISVMSTNYPKELESNIVDRPSRIRHFIEYKNPDEEQIKIICDNFGIKPDFFKKKDYSVDNIINVIKTSKELGISLKEANNKITQRRKFLSETFKSNQGGIGLSQSDDDDF